MRVLALSDIHGQTRSLSKILHAVHKLPGQPEGILISGDITDFESAEACERIIGSIVEAFPGIPLAAVGGNCDKPGVTRWLKESGYSAEAQCTALGPVLVAGAGGALLHTDSTPDERGEDDYARIFDPLRKELAAGTIPWIGLTHNPPLGVADFRDGEHRGSLAIREAIVRGKALAWVNGHIHEAVGVYRLNRQNGSSTLVLNPGPAKQGCFAFLTLTTKPEGGWEAQATLHEA